MPFAAWRCDACGRYGKARHAKGAALVDVGLAVGRAHIHKSLECHWKHGHLHVMVTVAPDDMKKLTEESKTANL